MAKFVFLILVIPHLACGDDFELKRLVTKFRAAADRWAPIASLGPTLEMLPADLLKRVSIRFGEMPTADKNGYCALSEENDPVIVLSQKHWAKYNEWGREAIAFHEMGHCVLHRDHDSVYISRNGQDIPRSLMHPYAISWEVYLLNRDYYLEELFQNLLTTPTLAGMELK